MERVAARRAWIAIAALFVTGCDQEPAAAPQKPERVAVAPTKQASDAAGKPIDGRSRQQAIVALSSTGIVIFPVKDEATTPTMLKFGQDRKAVLAQFTPAFAKPQLSSVDECGAGPMEFAKYGALTLNFLGDTFVGWYVVSGGDVVTTDGIRPGLSLAALKRERSVRMIESSLDGEFDYQHPDGGTIGGFANGVGDAAIIQSLFSGTTCFFR